MQTILLTVMAAVLGQSPTASEPGATVAERLDASLAIRIENMPIVEAFEEISERANIDIRVEQEALDALPYSGRTRVTLVLDHSDVRLGLAAICNQLGLDFAIRGDMITVTPSPQLRRIGRAATWDEIDTLAQLRTSEWSQKNEHLDQYLFSRLRFSGIGGEHDTNLKKLTGAVNSKRVSPIDAALSEACEAWDWTWFPQGKQIVVLPQEDQVARQLEGIVSVQQYGEPLANVLRDLSRRAGVTIHVEGHAAATIPLEIKENVTLVAEGISVKEAIIQIALTADLDYVIHSDEVILVRSDRAGPPARSRRSRNSIVGKISVPSQHGGFTYDWFIRESDLTPEENDKRELRIKDAVDAMKKELASDVLAREELPKED
jgi:hypothetical protein